MSSHKKSHRILELYLTIEISDCNVAVLKITSGLFLCFSLQNPPGSKAFRVFAVVWVWQVKPEHLEENDKGHFL